MEEERDIEKRSGGYSWKYPSWKYKHNDYYYDNKYYGNGYGYKHRGYGGYGYKHRGYGGYSYKHRGYGGYGHRGYGGYGKFHGFITVTFNQRIKIKNIHTVDMVCTHQCTQTYM